MENPNYYAINKVTATPMVDDNSPSTHQSNVTTIQSKKLRILSLDGGGIRAIIPAVIIAQLEADLQKQTGNPKTSIIDYFDLFVGTSAGSILAALYLTPDEQNPNRPKYTAQEVLNFYLQDGCDMFQVATPLAGKRNTEKYCTSILANKLQCLLGKHNTLEKLIKPAFFTAYNLDKESPVFFENWKKKTCKTWQVIRASTAASGLFKPAVVEGYDTKETLIDGSIFASNPALCAYTLANTTQFSRMAKSSFLKDYPTLAEMTLLSLGTGSPVKKVAIQKGSWIRIMMKNLQSAGKDLVDYQLQQLFSVKRGGAYFRMNPCLPMIANAQEAVEITHINNLHNIGLQYIMKNKEKLEKILDSLL